MRGVLPQARLGRSLATLRTRIAQAVRRGKEREGRTRLTSLRKTDRFTGTLEGETVEKVGGEG